MKVAHYSLGKCLEIRSDDDPIIWVDYIFHQHQQQYHITPKPLDPSI